jgi:NAD(P)-dependent dehydrogenase (short-subunit alcohol dehydrogenase family)
MTRKKVIVFGGSGYIGHQIVTKLAEQNYDCIVFDYISTPHPLAMKHTQIDIRDYEALQINLQSVMEENDEVYGVVFATGMSNAGDLVTQDFKEFEEVVQVNLLSVAFATKLILPYFIKQNRGNFIYIASVFSTVVGPEMIAYNTSKAALVHFAKSITEDYAKDGIRSNVISPGLVKSPMVDDVLKRTGNNPKWMHLVAGLEKKRIDVDTIVNTILFALEEKNSLNGANIIIDGGYSIH